LEEKASGVVLGWPLSPKDQLHALLNDHPIYQRFTAQNACFSCMSVVSITAQPVESDRRGDEATNKHIRGVYIDLIQAAAMGDDGVHRMVIGCDSCPCSRR